jgi:hypothetical protein
MKHGERNWVNGTSCKIVFCPVRHNSVIAQTILNKKELHDLDMWNKPDTTSQSGRRKAVSNTLDLSIDTTVSFKTNSII